MSSRSLLLFIPSIKEYSPDTVFLSSIISSSLLVHFTAMSSFKLITSPFLLLSLSSSVLSQVHERDSPPCPGVLNIMTGSIPSCCVGGVLPPLTLSVCAGWPICTGSTTVTPTTPPLSCVTYVAATGSDWNSIASSYSASLEKSGTTIHTTLGVTSITSTATPESSNINGTPIPTATSTVSAAVAVYSSVKLWTVCGALLAAVAILQS